MSIESDNILNIFLVGELDTQFNRNKLPSKCQVLQLLFHNTREVFKRNQNLRVSAKLVVDEVKIFCVQARLPIQKESRCIDKVFALHQEWSTLQKNAKKPFNRKRNNNSRHSFTIYSTLLMVRF